MNDVSRLFSICATPLLFVPNHTLPPSDVTDSTLFSGIEALALLYMVVWRVLQSYFTSPPSVASQSALSFTAMLLMQSVEA